MPMLTKLERAQAIMSYLAQNPRVKHTANSLSQNLKLNLSSVRRTLTTDYPRTFTELKTPPYGWQLVEPIVWPEEVEFDLYQWFQPAVNASTPIEDEIQVTTDSILIRQIHETVMKMLNMLQADIDLRHSKKHPHSTKYEKPATRYPAWIDEDHPQSVTSGKPITMEAAKIRFETYPDNPEYRRPGTRSTNNREAVNNGSEG